jgi:hypothetical protein
LRNLPNVGTGLESNELCVWAISDPAVIDIRRDRRADLVREVPLGCIVGAEFSSVGRDAGAESTASEGSFIQYQWFLELAARRSILIACLLQAIASPLSMTPALIASAT